MRQQLLKTLMYRWAGKPILVIGGGPSVTEDLLKIQTHGPHTPACVISANDHGSKQDWFGVDLYVNCDKEHIFKRVPMESILRPIVQQKGGAIVNKHSWADYRLGDWSFEANTGIAALVVAAALGGHPVIATGFDFWRTGRLYFHDGAGKKPSSKRRAQAVAFSLIEKRRKVHPLLAEIRGAHLRPISGPLTEAFPTYNPGEELPEYSPTPYRRKMVEQRAVAVEATHRLTFSSHDFVRPGHQMTLTEIEYTRYMDRVKLAR